MSSGSAKANANIALVKYWGKRQQDLNLPLTDSLSVTLEGLWVAAEVTLEHSRDTLTINGGLTEDQRLTRWCSAMRENFGDFGGVSVVTETNIPVGAGLASSAAAYAAIAAAVFRALGKGDDDAGQSWWARMGSGSAARSIYGGFVHQHAGVLSDGSDCRAEPVAAPNALDLHVVCAVISSEQKAWSSRDGMNHTVATSPLYGAWPGAVAADIEAGRTAIAGPNLKGLLETAEANALAMHATAMAARPSVIYLKPESFALISEIQQMREQGAMAYVTMDAGPNVKVMTNGESVERVHQLCEALSYVKRCIVCRPGAGVQ